MQAIRIDDLVQYFVEKRDQAMSKRVIKLHADLLASYRDLFITMEQLSNLESTGYETEELAYLGIGKREWKLLERRGLAMRARLPTSRGHRIRWLLIVK